MNRAKAIKEGVDFVLEIPAPLSFEESFWKREGEDYCLAGVDEAGRGPLAGPVVAGAVSMAPVIARELRSSTLAALTDSKKLSSAQRDSCFSVLTTTPGVHWAIGVASPDEIDSLNILRATHLAMRRALEGLPCGVPKFALVDGLSVRGLPCPHEAIVKGDARSFFVSAASIVAKVSRDREMDRLEGLYPGYGFSIHKGYPTAAHLDALSRLGPSPCHRRTFGPVADLLAPRLF